MNIKLLVLLGIVVSSLLVGTPTYASDPYRHKIPFTFANTGDKELLFRYDDSHAMDVYDKDVKEFKLQPGAEKSFQGKMINRTGSTTWFRYRVYDKPGHSIGIAEVVAPYPYQTRGKCTEAVVLGQSRSTAPGVIVKHPEYVCQAH